MPARPLGGRDQHVAAAAHARDERLHQAELGRVDEVVGGVDREHGRHDGLEVGRGVVVARGVELEEHVVGLGARQPARNLRFEEGVRGLSRRRVLLPLDRGRAHQDQQPLRAAEARHRRLLVLAARESRVVPDRIHERLAPDAVAADDGRRRAGQRHERVHEGRMRVAPHPSVHAAHRGAQQQPQVGHAQPVRQQPVLERDHVGVAVLREPLPQAVAGLARPAVSDRRRAG